MAEAEGRPLKLFLLRRLRAGRPLVGAPMSSLRLRSIYLTTELPRQQLYTQSNSKGVFPKFIVGGAERPLLILGAILSAHGPHSAALALRYPR